MQYEGKVATNLVSELHDENQTLQILKLDKIVVSSQKATQLWWKV